MIPFSYFFVCMTIISNRKIKKKKEQKTSHAKSVLISFYAIHNLCGFFFSCACNQFFVHNFSIFIFYRLHKLIKKTHFTFDLPLNILNPIRKEDKKKKLNHMTFINELFIFKKQFTIFCLALKNVSRELR